MANYLDIIINDQPYVNYTRFTLKKSMDEAAAEYEIDWTIDTEINKLENLPFKYGDKINIQIGGISLLTGYLENAKIISSNDEHTLTIKGRDVTCDLIDSSVDGSLSLPSPTNLVKVLETVLKNIGLSLPIIDNTSGLATRNDSLQTTSQSTSNKQTQYQQNLIASANFVYKPKATPVAATPIDSASSQVGQQAWDFVQQYAKKAQVLVTTDGEGRIVLERASTERLPIKLIQKEIDPSRENNIISSDFEFNGTKLFNKYTVITQQDPAAAGDTPDTDSVVNQKAIAFDNLVRSSRKKTISSDTSSTTVSIANRAIWARNFARGDALKYTCKVMGFFADSLPQVVGKTLWRPNRLVEIEDELAGVKTTLLIKSVAYTFSDADGSGVELECTYPGAYLLDDASFGVSGINFFANSGVT